MIGRFWQGRAADARHADAYQRLFDAEIVAGLNAVAGFRGAYLFRREHEGEVELMTLTLFDSLTAIRRFAGDDRERAVVTPEARAVLSFADPVVRHFEVAVAPRGR